MNRQYGSSTSECSVPSIARAPAVDVHEERIQGTRYLSLELLREHEKGLLKVEPTASGQPDADGHQEDTTAQCAEDS